MIGRSVAPSLRPLTNSLPALVAAAGCVALGGAIAFVHPSVDAALVTAIAIVSAGPLVSRLAHGRLDVFEPIVITNFALLVMYVARPTAMLAVGGPHAFKGYEIDGRITYGLVLALLGVVGAQIGYASSWGSRIARRLPALGGEFDVPNTTVLALGLSLLALVLFGLFLESAGGFGVLKQLIEGRSQLQEAYFEGSSAYLYSAPQLLWPASLLLMAMGVANRRKDFVVLSFVVLVPLAVFAGGRGARVILIPLLLSPVVFRYLARNRRPKPLAVAVGLYLIFTVGIAYFRDTRTAGTQISRTAELRHAVLDPSYEFRQLVLKGTDVDMFESLAVETEVVPSKLPISPGDWIYRTAAKPIPSQLWHHKPLAPNDRLIKTLYPLEVERSSSSAGLLGDLYLFGGAPGIVAGMFLLGALFRAPWAYLARDRSSVAAQLMLTVSLMFIPILLRGTIGDTMARALFGFIPLVVAMRLCMGRRERSTEPRR